MILVVFQMACPAFVPGVTNALQPPMVAQWPPMAAGGPGRAAQLSLLGKFKVQWLV